MRGPKYIIIHTDDKTPTTHAHEKYNCKPGKKTTRTDKVHTRDTLTYTYIQLAHEETQLLRSDKQKERPEVGVG